MTNAAWYNLEKHRLSDRLGALASGYTIKLENAYESTKIYYCRPVGQLLQPRTKQFRGERNIAIHYAIDIHSGLKHRAINFHGLQSDCLRQIEVILYCNTEDRQHKAMILVPRPWIVSLDKLCRKSNAESAAMSIILAYYMYKLGRGVRTMNISHSSLSYRHLATINVLQ